MLADQVVERLRTADSARTTTEAKIAINHETSYKCPVPVFDTTTTKTRHKNDLITIQMETSPNQKQAPWNKGTKNRD